MTDSRKQRLIDLGVEALADALLNCAVHSDAIDDLIEQLIASPEDNIQQFKKKLSDLSHSRRFIHRNAAAGFCRELKMLLQSLKADADDPLTGLKLAATFYEADKRIFEMCDDSSGNVGDLFRYDAKELFVHYASRYSDKEHIAHMILQLNQKDDYGIRNTLVHCAAECLPVELIRTMIARLQLWADKEKDEYSRRHHLHSIESLARQIKDPKLFEKTRIAAWGKLSTAAFIDIARVYLDSGDVETAHAWLKKIAAGDNYHAYQRDKLLEKIYQQQGNPEKLQALLHQRFQSHHSTATLQALLDVIGHDQRDNVINDAIELILTADELKASDAEFLITVEKIDQAEEYLLERAHRLNGNYYDSMLSLAEAMESENRHLIASLIFRSLLISILESGNTKAYRHGIRYLKKLDKHAKAVTDWQKFTPHQAFKEQLIEAHGRKRSFWSKYDAKQ